MSPETAAATARKGVFTDPRDLGIEHPEYRAPDSYLIDDSMVLLTSYRSDVEVFRSPNIGPPRRIRRCLNRLPVKWW